MHSLYSRGVLCLAGLFCILGLISRGSGVSAAGPQVQTKASPSSASLDTGVPQNESAPNQISVPSYIKYTGVLKDSVGKPLSGPVDVNFSIYGHQDDAQPLWQETQTVQADEHGNYSVLLGITTASGMPAVLFQSGEARWLGVTVGTLPEQPRVYMASVPYAIKAGDAQTLGGKPASAYILAQTTNSGIAAANLTAAMVTQKVSSATRTNMSKAETSTTPNATTTNVDSLDIADSLTVGDTPTQNGQTALIPDNEDTVHSFIGQAGSQLHFRLSRSSPDANGAKDFLIAPYNYGMGIEYPGSLEVWAEDFSIHQNHQTSPTSTSAAHLWVGDEFDGGGWFITAQQNSPHPELTNGFTSLAADRFDHTSHGSMLFQVRNVTDMFRFQSGPYNSEVTKAQISTTAATTNLDVYSGSVQGTMRADSNTNTFLVGPSSSTPLGFIAGGGAQKASLFPDGNFSIGNMLDQSLLSVGSSGQFQVNSTGILTSPSGTFNGQNGSGTTLQVTQTGGGVGELATSSGYMGIWGQTSNPTGTGVRGEATAPTGGAVGVFGVARSPSAVAGRFDNTVGGMIISGTRNGNPRFGVDGNGNVSATGNFTGNQVVSTAASGVPPLIVNSNTQVQNLNASLLGGLPASAFAGLAAGNSFTGDQTVPNLVATGSITTSTSPSQYGQANFMRDDLDTVHSFIGQAGSQLHFRLSRSSPDPSGAQNFLIAPYNYGMGIEYPGVLEVWTEDFSIHQNHQTSPKSGAAAHLWVGDEFDGGGWFITARQNSAHPELTNGFASLSADRFDHTSHGSMLFQVRNVADMFRFQSGPFNSEVTKAQISTTATSTNFDVYSGSVQGTLRVDSGNNSVLVGASSNNPLALVAGSGAPKATLFPDGNLSIGNAVDQSVLAVGNAGQFQVDSGGNMTSPSGIFNGAAGSGATLQVTQLANGVGDLTVSAGYMGIWGQTSSTAGTAVRGEATASTGGSVGLFGVARSPNGIAGRFDNIAGGPILIGAQNGVQRFSVDGSGNVAATGSLNAVSAALTGSVTIGGGTPILKHLSATASLTFPAFPGQSCNDSSIGIAGASDGDTIALGIPNALASLAGVTWSGWVSASGQVTVRGCNATASSTPAPGVVNVRVDVWKH